MERFTSAFPLLLVALLAALSYWLAHTVEAPVVPRDGSARHDPDYIVENFVAMRMGPDGTRLHQLEADRMLHYPDDDSTQLENPRLLKFDGDRLALSISATRAWLSSKGETVDFDDNVRAVRTATDVHSELVLTTDYLHVVPDDDFASTDRPVKIVDANTQVTAVGLELNNNAQTLKLMSNVRGSYVQQKK